MNVRGPLFDGEADQLVEFHATPRSPRRDEGITLSQPFGISYSFRRYESHRMAEPRKIDRNALEPRLADAFDFAARQVRAMSSTTRTFSRFIPEKAAGGMTGSAGPTGAAGFHAGMMWLIWQSGTGESEWRQHGRALLATARARQHDRQVHDLGFIFLNTYLPGIGMTGGRPGFTRCLVTAGRTLALRYNEKGQYLRSFVAPESLFIDIMMNVPLIFYAAAAQATGGCDRLARAHCRTTASDAGARRRLDGSRRNLRSRVPASFCGSRLIRDCVPSSTWSRGLAWSLYGFAKVFAFTGRDPADLAVAVRNADCFIGRCPESFDPALGFRCPAWA